VLGLNAAKVYKFDLEALAKQAAKSGPTPEQVDQPLPLADVRDSYCYLFQNRLRDAA